MEFLRRNINKQSRNGDIISSSISSSYIGGSNSGGGVVSGNYLPATMNDENIYIVPHYVTFQETTTTTDIDGNETETIKNLLEITSNGIIVNGNIIASGEVSAFGSGSTSGSNSGSTMDIEDNLTSNRTDAALSANQGRILKEMIDNIDVSDVDIDLSEYSKTSHTHSNYSLTSHTHAISAITNLQTTLDSKATNTDLTAHTANTTYHITSNERTKWDETYTNLNDWFYKDSNGNIHSKYNLIGDNEISAYGSGETGNTSIDLENYYTKDEVDDLIDNIDVIGIDLSEYSKTSHTHSNYALTSHTHSGYALTSHNHPISAVTNLQSTLDGKSSTSHTHTQYASSSHTHAISAVTNLQSTLDAKTTNTAFTAHTANTTYHITSNERTKWNDTNTNFNDWFYKDSSGNIHSKYNFIGDNEISAYGSGSTSGGSGNVDIDLSDYYTKDEVDDLIANVDIGDIDLSDYSKTSHTHSNYALTSHTHSGYASTSHTHTIANITNLQSALDGKSSTSHTHSTYSLTSHTHPQYASSSHTHNYASIVKVGSTSYNISGNTISLPSYPTLSSLSGVSTSTFNTHSGNTTLHITATERTNWNKAYTNNHTHSNKSVLDGITSTKVSNWDTVYSNWNKAFSFDSSGNLKVSVNVIGEGEISAYGSGTSSSSGAITIVDNLTSTLTDAALSANQGRVLKNLIDNIDIDNIDLSGYSKTSHTHSNYSLTSHTHSGYASTSHTHTQYASSSHTHPISAITNLQTTLNGKSSTSHTHSTYSLTSHTHSTYYDSAVSRTKNTVLAAPNGSAGTATFRALVAADIPSLAISKITNLQSTLDGKSSTSHTHSNYSLTSHTHSAYATTGHTHSSLTFSGGTFSAKTYNPSGATTVNIPTSTSHLTNNSGFITSAATVAAANKVTSTLTFTTGTTSTGSYNGSSAVTIKIPSNTTHLTNGSGFITSAATVANSNKFSGYTMRSAATWVNNSVEAYIQYTIDATSLSTSYFYPIIFPSTQKDLYVRMYSTAGSASAAYNQNKLEFTFRGQGWNDTPQGLTVHFYNCYSSSETTIGCIGMGQEGGMKCIWVRGGLTYYVVSNITPSLKTSNYTNSNEIYTTGSTLHGGTNTKVTVYWTPQTTSGLGTLYHSGGIKTGGGLTVGTDASIGGTLTSTGAISGKSGAVITGTTTSTAFVGNYLKYNNGYGASLSSAGWYRFATSSVANNAGGTYIFSIRRSYYNTNNEAYIISCTVDYSKVHWCQLNGSANTRLITQIRCTFTNNSTMYFDFYYNGTVANEVYVNAVGNCTLQTPTKTTSTLTTSSVLSLTDGIKLGTDTAYPITIFRNATNGGAYIMYGANGQLTKSWATGSDTSHNFAWYYKDTSAGTDICKMKLTSAGTLNSDYWMLNNTVSNPYLKLTHTYNSTTYTHYLQGYNGYLYLGAGSSKSLRIDGSGNCLSVGEVTAYSDKRLKKNIKPLEVRGELNPVTYIKDGKRSVGFIAQEVQELYPELVHTDEGTEEKYLSLNYAQLTAVLYAEIKELKERLSKLEKE